MQGNGGQFGGGGASGGWGESGAPAGGAGAGGGGAAGAGAAGSGGAAGGGAAGGGGGAAGGGAAGGNAAGGSAGGAAAGGGGIFGARVASAAKSMQVADTGNAKVDAMGDVLNNALAPFSEAPDPAKGVLGVVEQGIGAVMGLQNAPLELLNTGFAMVTAPIAAMMPAFPAAYLTVPHLGTPHAHAHPPSLIPPAPPVPLPSIGTLMLPGCVSVLISGMPAGRAGDLGLAVTCGSLAPAFDVFLGSSNTFIGGNRAARMTDMTRHCNPASKSLIVSRGAAVMGAAIGAVGVGAAAAAGQALAAAMQAAQIAADAAAAALSALLGVDPGIPPAMGALMLGNPTVLIGGFPCPNFPNPLDGLMKGLKKLGSAIAKSKGFGKLAKRLGLCNAPGEPINPFTGEVYNDFEDYRAGEGGFTWERHYRSGWHREDGPLGYGFRHFYQRKLTLLRKRAIYETHDNESVALERLSSGEYELTDGFELTTADQRRYVLTTDRNETLEFEALRTTPPSARLVRYKTNELDVYAFYDAAGRLSALTEVAAHGTFDTHFGYDANGRIEQLARGMRGQQPRMIARYVYQDGCLVEWQDPAGARTRFRYDAARRMVQGTDRRGYSFHWHYDPNSGRCIKSYGDDGLWGVEARYEGGQSFFTEPDGGVWGFKFYPDGTISHIVDPCGGVKQYRTDDSGRIVKQVTPGGVEYDWLYDATGRHYGRRDAFGNFLLPEDEDPNPEPLAHDGPITAKGFLCGRPLDELGPAWKSLPAPIEATLLSLRVHFGLASGTGAVSVQRDVVGRPVAQAESDGSVRSFAYDAEGNVVGEHLSASGPAAQRMEQEPRRGWRTREYASWNLLAVETSPLGNTTRYAHTHRGSYRAILDPNGNQTDYTRDQRDRITEIHRYGELYRRYRYDAHDAVIEEQDGSGNSLVTYRTGANGLHVAAQLGSGETYSYAYDEQGRFTRASSSLHEVKQAHSGALCLLDERDGKGVRHECNTAGVLTRSTYFGRFEVSYDYEEVGEVQIRTPDGSTHRVWQTPQQVVRENGNGSHEALIFDAEHRLGARARWGGDLTDPQTVWTAGYRYGAGGTLVERFDSLAGSESFEYDSDLRLVSLRGARRERAYAYDPAGNLITNARYRFVRYAAGNLPHQAEFEHYSVDARRRLSRRDRSGAGSVEYVYDSQDQLVLARFSERSEVWRAAYDGLGRRIWREYAGERSDFYWDGDRLAAERAPDGKLRLYVYANQDALVPFLWLDYASEDSPPESGQAFYLFAAPNGMPVRVEDARGKLVWHSVADDPYGEFDENTPPCPTRLRFAGHFYDEHLGLFYNRFRDYDPGLGRYLQPDPLGHAGGVNLYAYPANPLADVDLRGLVHRTKKNSSADGSQNPNKRPKEKDRPPKLKGVSKSERALAASPGNSLAQRRARKKVVTSFLDGNAQEWDNKTKSFRKPTKTEIRKHMRGHDLTKPVVVGPPPALKSKQHQWQRQGGNQGQYYGDKDSTPSELGIAGYSRGKDGRYQSKEQKEYKVDKKAPYLESTSKPINDDWSVSGQKVPAKGGAQQRVIGDRSKAKPV